MDLLASELDESEEAPDMFSYDFRGSLARARTTLLHREGRGGLGLPLHQDPGLGTLRGLLLRGVARFLIALRGSWR